ncbi:MULTISPECIES: YxeA family protein [Paenibacillus]|uniref:Amino acid ABC transporter ATP-binding protein n=1 Tax=Paenibacillus albilobatus TaxID=2716884 RepID=A0A920C9V2_9BACL|nr:MULTISPECIES: YxeA family protein [Paenibacillus]GIO31510.1 amino acid ABC transporter ATP-binding protein [Paenibacillus albilobatus]
MKKGIIALAVVLIVLVGFVVFIQNVNLNRIGAEQYYVQINQDGKKIEDKSDGGQKYVSYEYALEGFDSNGKEKNLTFRAFKELRKDAYLRIYVKGDGVSSYQEVQAAELPEGAKRKLETAGK